MLETKMFSRRSFDVEAVQVTADNMVYVADWCHGRVRYRDKNKDPNNMYIKVKVSRPINMRQTQAFIGDWVSLHEGGFKVYTQKAFEKSFEPIETEPDYETPEIPGMPKVGLFPLGS